MSGPTLSAAGETARRGDTARFEAALFAPADRRERLFALIALNVELARIPETVSEPLLGEIRLQWWSDAFEALFNGDADAGHEVIAALAAPVAAGVLAKDRLMSLIDARRFALDPDQLADDAALDRFLADTGGAMAALQVSALGGDELAANTAAQAGWAEGAGRLIGALPALLASGAAPTPLSAGDGLNAALEGDAPAELTAAVRVLAEKALVRLADARRNMANIPKDCRAPLLSLRTEERRLRAVLAPDADIFADTGAVSPFREKASLFGRALLGKF